LTSTCPLPSTARALIRCVPTASEPISVSGFAFAPDYAILSVRPAVGTANTAGSVAHKEGLPTVEALSRAYLHRVVGPLSLGRLPVVPIGPMGGRAPAQNGG
jgi:hypothetical protein